jgi:dTDP-D-glucose 4,6-dehydratase
MILHARDGKPLPVYGDGQQVRTGCLWMIIVKPSADLREGKIGQTYAIGGDNQPANLVIVETICEIMDEVSVILPMCRTGRLIQFVADRPDMTGAMIWTLPKSGQNWLGAPSNPDNRLGADRSVVPGSPGLG